MTARAYLKASLGEYALLLLCACTLQVLVMDGFYVSPELQFGPVPVAVSSVLLAVLYFAAWRKRTLLAGSIAAGAVVVAVFALALALSASSPYDDAFGNWFWAAVVVVAVTLAGFLLTRTVPGAGAWFVACVFTASCVHLFFETDRLLLTLAVLFSALALLVYRNFRAGQASVDSAQGTSTLANLAVATVPLLVLIASACGLWFAVIAPLDPGTVDVKLLTEYRKENIEQVRGVGTAQMDVDTELTSDQTVKGERFTTDDLKVSEDAKTVIDVKAIEKSSTPQQGDDDGGGGKASGSAQGSRDTLDRDSLDKRWNPLSYTAQAPWAPIVLGGLSVLLLALIAYLVVRRRRRRLRLERMLLSGGPAAQASAIYLFLLGKMRLLGYPVPPGQTLAGFAWNQATRMEQLRYETHVPFAALTETYVKIAYGNYEPTEDEVVPFVAFYLRFWKAARAQLGSVRYFFKSLRLG